MNVKLHTYTAEKEFAGNNNNPSETNTVIFCCIIKSMFYHFYHFDVDLFAGTLYKSGFIPTQARRLTKTADKDFDKHTDSSGSYSAVKVT